MTDILLTDIDHLYTCDDDESVLADAYVHVSGNRIAGYGPMLSMPEVAGAEKIDMSGTLVTPGFVNTHHHFFQHLTRAVPYTQTTQAIEWLAGSYPLWGMIDTEMMYAACLAASCELLQTGATTSADCSYLLPETDGEMAAAEMAAVRDAGIRFHFHRGCMPTIEGDLETQLKVTMGDRLDYIIDDELAMMGLMEKAIDAYHDPSDGSMCRVALGPTGVTYTKPDIMGKIASLAGEAGCGLHTHFHPRQDEYDKYGGRRPIGLLAEQGWIKPGTWFAHSTMLDAEDIRIVAENGVGVAHCPHTIIRLGYRIAPIGAMRDAGVRLGIGVDGAASNDTGCMIGDVRLAMMLHRVGHRPDADPPSKWMTPYDTLKLATRGGADVLGRDDIGRIAVGACADIVAFPMHRLSCAGAVADPLGALLMSGVDPYTSMTMVNGVVRVRDGSFVDINESAVIDQLNAASRSMMEQAIAHTGIRFDQRPPTA